MAIKQLHCYCDHCANNTCSTNQLCYAEWKLVTGLDHEQQQQQLQHKQAPPTQSNSFASPTDLLGTSSASSSPFYSSSSAAVSYSNSNSSPSSTSTSTLVSQASQQLASQVLTPAANIRLEKNYNCFKKDDPLLIHTVCNETATNTSHVIRRCCHSGDYCNKDTNLLPTEEEALEEIRKYLPAFDPSQQHRQNQQNHRNNNMFADFFEQYSSLPLALQITIGLSALLLFVYIITLMQNVALDRRRRRRRNQRGERQHHSQRHRGHQHYTSSEQTNAFKRVLNRILFNFGRRTSALFGRSQTGEQDQSQRDRLRSPSGCRDSRRIGDPMRDISRSKGTVHHVPEAKSVSPQAGQSSAAARPSGVTEDYSEYSSSKANSDMAVFDTNSMASREPLIGNQSKQMHIHPGSNHPYQPSPLNQQHPGPYMADETYNGRTQTAFQMTLGSAAGAQYKQEASSGSGAGQPYLTQRSIAHDIELCEVVGRGFFGVVWRGEYKGEPVAVKIFSPVAEPSWEREAEIYQTTMLRHKNILGFIATDKRHDAALTGYWLVTDYYPMGSLYDFIKDHTMSMADAIRMAFSIANGLSHLHIEIFGTRGKPAIAHRDLKSKNILVKNDGTCCIADLGMAVRYNSNTGVVDVPTNTRIGTRRYLAPEILENKLNLMDFESVKATDIYALGLVLWEIIRRACLMQPEMDPNGYAYGAERRTMASPGQFPSQSDRPGLEGTSGSGALPQEASEVFSTASSNFSSSKPVELQPLQGDSSSRQPLTTQSEAQMQTGMRQPPHHQSFMTNESLDTTFDDLNSELALVCEPYEAPYQPYVPMDPTAEDMREVVCVRKIRPALAPRWSKFASMRDYVTLMTECWYDKPQSRLSALRVRKSLSDVARKYFDLHMEYD